MNMTLEIERRYLVKLPLKWYARAKLLFANRVEIYQTYLNELGEENSRVRALIKHDFDLVANGGVPQVSYTYARKKFVETGINEEVEIVISNSLYQEKLKYMHPKKRRIEKTRYFIEFDNRVFELDVYKDTLLGLAILEIELSGLNEKILLPPYFEIEKEITGERQYANINLATLHKLEDL